MNANDFKDMMAGLKQAAAVTRGEKVDGVRMSRRVVINDITRWLTCEWSAEDDVYIARCDDYPSMGAHGDTVDDAFSEIAIALGGLPV